MDPKNRWCPTWIVRNYEVHNNCVHGLPHLSAPPAPLPRQHDEKSDDEEMFPHCKHYNVKFKFSRSGEPEAAEPADEHDPNENLETDDRWAASNRTGWQQHSAAGPNVRPEGRLVHVSPLESVVYPPDFNYDENEFHVHLDDARHTWETLQDVSHQYSDESLERSTLNDDYQQLFVDIVLTHVEEITKYIYTGGTSSPVKPLRLLLLGTAGTGETTTVQTALQECLRRLQKMKLPFNFLRVAAPTGCAAFNMHFNATTIHRLIHHFRLGSFSELSDTALNILQNHLKEMSILFLDEMSMIGRQFMGRVDSRLNQANAGLNPTGASLGGVSSIFSGDHAQFEAISDQQPYDTCAHRDTASAGE